MIKPLITIEVDISSFKDILDGTDLLNASINYDRARNNKSSVCVHEDYFLRSAVRFYLEKLREDIKTENFN